MTHSLSVDARPTPRAGHLRRLVSGALGAALLVSAVPVLDAAAQSGAPKAETSDHVAALSPSMELALAGTEGADRIDGFVNFRRDVPERHQVETLRNAGFPVVRTYEGVDAHFVVGSAAQYRTVIADRDVVYVEGNDELEFFGDTARDATRVTEVQSSAVGGSPYRDSTGNVLDGSGIGVAVIDSGVVGSHPDLRSRMGRNIKIVCASPGLGTNAPGHEKDDHCFADYVVYEETGGEGSAVVYQDVEDSDTTSGHGTHVAGIVAGDGTASNGLYKGVAPGATLYGLSTGEAINIFYATEAYKWVDEHHADPCGDGSCPEIRVINNSWGCSNCEFKPNSVVNKLVNALVGKGVVSLFAVGNDGGVAPEDEDIGDSPADDDQVNDYAENPLPGVIGVANYDDDFVGNRDNELDNGSSRGVPPSVDGDGSYSATGNTDPNPDNSTTGEPAEDLRIDWPDIAAPGSAIISTCRKDLAVCDTGPAASWEPWYASLYGTSMATPHVAGAVAVLLQADPSLTPAAVEDLIQDTARKFQTSLDTGVATRFRGVDAQRAYFSDPQNPDGTTSFDKGAGLLDVRAALEELAARQGTPSTFSLDGYEVVEVAGSVDPAGSARQGDTVTLSGTVDHSDRVLSRTVLVDDDGGDYQAAGALDVVSVEVVQDETGVEWHVAFRDLSQRHPAGNSFRLYHAIDGIDATFSVAPTADGTVTISTVNASSAHRTAPTSARIEGNTVVARYDYVDLQDQLQAEADAADATNGATVELADALVHDIWVATYGGAIQDVAPGGGAQDFASHPARAPRFAINASPTLFPADRTPQVSVSIKGENDIATTPVDATVTGDGGSYTWTADVVVPHDVLGDSTVNATVAVAGDVRATATTGIVIIGAPTAPGAPDNLRATLLGDGTSVRLDWDAPFDGNDPITGYTVRRDGAQVAELDASTTSFTDSGLKDGDMPSYSVIAANSIGSSPAATTVATIPTAPEAPASITAAAIDHDSAAISWTEPADDGGAPVTAYTVTRDGDAVATVAGTVRSLTDDDAIGGATHTYAVVATNAKGDSPAATTTVTMPATPRRPQPPVITSPVADALVPGTHSIAGTARPGTRIRVWDGGTVIAVPTTGGDGTWSVQVTLPDGQHSLVADATDEFGRSKLSQALSYGVDATSAAITVDTADGAQFVRGVEVRGSVSDAHGVVRVSVRYTNADLGFAFVSPSQKVCFGCGTTSARFLDRRSDLPPGRYRVRVTAEDVVGNVSYSTVAITVL